MSWEETAKILEKARPEAIRTIVRGLDLHQLSLKRRAARTVLHHAPSGEFPPFAIAKAKKILGKD